jgi:hypothetical protein
MSARRLTAIGIFPTATQAEVGVDMLIMKGFKSAGISVLLPERPNNQPAHPDAKSVAQPVPQTTKTGSAAAVGATGGSALFGALGLLVGAGALAIPGVGPLLAAGPLVAGLAGLGVGGALGGLTGALVGMGLPEDQTKRYLGHIGAGRTLVVADCDNEDQVSVAKVILEASGAEEVNAASEFASRVT